MIIIFLLVLPMLSCYISSEEENTVFNTAEISLMLPESIFKAAATGSYFMEVIIVDIDFEELFAEASSFEEVEDYFYYNLFNLGTSGSFGDPLNLIVNNLRVDDNYYAIAYYYNEDWPEDGSFFVTFEPFSVTEKETATVMLYEMFLEPPAAPPVP
jgi:hypothetical protein